MACKGSLERPVFALTLAPSRSRSPQLAQAIAAFILDRRIAGVTDATIACYRYQLGPFLRWCEDADLDLSGLATDAVRAFLADRQRRSQSALHAAAVNLKTFFRWAARESMCEDLAARIRIPKVEEKVVAALTVPQLQAMLARCASSAFVDRRNDALLRFFLDAGVRVSEAIALDVDRLDLENGRALVSGKGRKERHVFYGPKTQRSLLRYVAVRRAVAAPATTMLFVNRDGSPMNRRHVHQLVTRLGARAGIEGVRVSPHTLRHSSALLFLKRGGDALTLQRLLGHTDIRTTRRYVNATTADLEVVHRRAAPGDLL